LAVSDEERETLERWARRPTTAQALAQRARIVLSCATGQSNDRVAAALGVTRQTVGRWRQRFVTSRVEGLLDEPRPGAPRKMMLTPPSPFSRYPLVSSGLAPRNPDILIFGMTATMTIQVRGRGTLTLPASLREKYRLGEGDPLTVVDLDGAVLLSPRLLVVPRLAAEMERLRRARKLSLKDLGGPARED
jgi:bifunctional DNA-binding transcriptional regulator/antitoxin component of YhaV-PrlF toxin-antitoxin module